MDTILIGICGRSGAGKSFVCSVFASFGGCHIDTDKVYHDLLKPVDGALSPCAASLAEEFGNEIIDGLIAADQTAKLSQLDEAS